MDVGEVRAYAEVFARAVASEDADLVASYLSPDRAAHIMEVLEAIPRPIAKTAILMVTVVPAELPGDEGEQEFVSLTEFSGRKGRSLLSCRWTTDDARVTIRLAQIVP